MARLVAILEK